MTALSRKNEPEPATRLRPPYSSLLDLIGETPIVELTKFDTGRCRLFIKLESQNPGGSIKDRIALSMIADAERYGRLTPGRHHRRGDRRQYRARPGPGRHPQGLPASCWSCPTRCRARRSSICARSAPRSA